MHPNDARYQEAKLKRNAGGKGLKSALYSYFPAVLVKCRALWGEPERVDAAYTVGLYYCGTLQYHGYQKGVAEEGLGEQQKLIIILKFHKVHVINHK